MYSASNCKITCKITEKSIIEVIVKKLEHIKIKWHNSNIIERYTDKEMKYVIYKVKQTLKQSKINILHNSYNNSEQISKVIGSIIMKKKRNLRWK